MVEWSLRKRKVPRVWMWKHGCIGQEGRPMPTEQMETTDLTLSEIMNRWPQTVTVFLGHGMMCVGCRIGPFHTITDACEEYQLDEQAFRQELQKAL